MRWLKSSVPKFPCACSTYPAFFSGKFCGRLCTSAPRTAVFRSAKKMLLPSLSLCPLCHRSSIFSPPYIPLSFQHLKWLLIDGNLLPLSHVPPAHSRHSLPGLKEPVHSCRLCASVTAHSSMPVCQDWFNEFLFWHTVIQLAFPMLFLLNYYRLSTISSISVSVRYHLSWKCSFLSNIALSIAKSLYLLQIPPLAFIIIVFSGSAIWYWTSSIQKM